MNDEAKLSMLLNKGLEPLEQKKVERLDVLISEKFTRAGLVARLCRGSGTGQQRVLTFFTDIKGTVKVGSVRANDFLTASDDEAVAIIDLSSSRMPAA